MVTLKEGRSSLICFCINWVSFYLYILIPNSLNTLAPLDTGHWQPPALHLYRHMINHVDSNQLQLQMAAMCGLIWKPNWSRSCIKLLSLAGIHPKERKYGGGSGGVWHADNSLKVFFLPLLFYVELKTHVKAAAVNWIKRPQWVENFTFSRQSVRPKL